MRTKIFKNRLLSVALMVAMMIVGLGFIGIANNAYAAENEITVYVTVSNAGELATGTDGTKMVNIPVTVEADANGLATVDTVLAKLHEKHCPGGYALSGTYVTNFWNETHGGYLFAVNHMLFTQGVDAELVGNGDCVDVLVMKDLTYWSDLYSFFDKTTAVVKVGEEVELTLNYGKTEWAADYSSSEYVTNPVVGADVYVAGAADTVLATTDTMGKAFVSFDEAGTYVVTASGAVSTEVTTDWQTGATAPFDAPISAPACVITVEADEPVIEDEPAAEEDEPAVEDEDEPAVEDEEPAVEGDDEPAAENQEEPVAEEETEKSPATGDTSQLAVYLLVLMAAAGSTIYTVRKQK